MNLKINLCKGLDVWRKILGERLYLDRQSHFDAGWQKIEELTMSFVVMSDEISLTRRTRDSVMPSVIKGLVLRGD